MTYQKPICDCGAELYFEVDEVRSVTYKILKNGGFAKQPSTIGSKSNANFGNLVCIKCSKQYEHNASFIGEHKFKEVRGDEL